MSNQQGLADDDDFELTFMLFALDVLSVELVSLEATTKEVWSSIKFSDGQQQTKASRMENTRRTWIKR